MSESIEELKRIIESAPTATEFFGANWNDEYVPLHQCKESSEWLYWTGYEWSPTELESGDTHIPVEHIRRIIGLEEENKRLRQQIKEMSELCLTNEEVDKLKSQAIREALNERELGMGFNQEIQSMHDYANKLEGGE